jgi:SRSO17 transposase
LSERGLLWAVGLSRRQNVYPADVALNSPVAKAGKRRKYHIPDQPPVSAETLLAGGKWQKVSWRRGTEGRLTCLFAARRVRVADGHKHRMLDNRMQCMPGDEVWLVGERLSTGEQKYYVSNLPADATTRRSLRRSKRDGSVNRPTSSSRSSLGSTTSKVDPGRDYIDMR